MSQIIRFKDLLKLDKKGLHQLGASHAVDAINGGNYDATVLTVQARKAAEYIKAFIGALDYETRLQLTQDPLGWEDVYGAHLSLSSTGDRLAYESDDQYMHLVKRMAERKALLDVAYKSEEAIFDSLGEQVEKVKVKTYSKEMLKVKL